MILATWKLSPWQKIVSCRIEAMPKTKKPKKTKLKRHKIDTIRDLGKSLDKSTQSSTHVYSVLAHVYSAQYWKK